MSAAADPPAPPANAPFISVVIASVNGFPWIGACLAALTTQRGGLAYEVLVLDRCGAGVREEIRRRFPQEEIRVMPVEGGVPIIINGRVVGGVGASGARSSQRESCPSATRSRACASADA